jgi:hypothetical protein
MTIKRIRNHGKWVWQARVSYLGRRRAAFRESKDAARDAEADLRRGLKAEVEQAEQVAAKPATLRQLLEYYALDMAARGKGEESVGRVEYTGRSIEALMPELLEKPVGAIADADLFAYRNLRAREGSTVYKVVAGQRVKVRVPTKPSTINRDLRTLRAALKKARPDYRFPGGAFFPEDETRVRWLRPRRGAARARADALTIPGDREARRAHPDAPGRDPSTPPGGRAPGAGGDHAAPGEGRRPPRDPERERQEAPADAARWA